LRHSTPRTNSASPEQKHPYAVAVFARAPRPGKAKTRLIPLLGSRGAAELQAALIADSIRKVNALAGRASRYLFFAGRRFRAAARPSGYRLVRQRGRDLGGRLERAFLMLLGRHSAAVVIGTDSPTLAPRALRAALRELRVCAAVLGPCPDGGFYLIGLRRAEADEIPGLFRRVRWGSAFAFRDTLGNLLRRGLACSILEPCADVDRPEDFRSLTRELVRSRAARRAAPAVWRYVRDRGLAQEGQTADRGRATG
jgi:rSAM/selenodomain-associated transferase 1